MDKHSKNVGNFRSKGDGQEVALSEPVLLRGGDGGEWL